MRKIISQEEIEKKRKRNTLLISIFLLAVLVVGTVGYGFISSPGKTKNTDGKIKEGVVVSVGNQWAVLRNGQTFYLSNSPESTENISVTSSKKIDSYVGVPLYIVSENEAITREISSVIGKYSSRVQIACHGPCESDLPEKNCSENLIVWEDSSENKVYQEEDCIFINGDLRAADAFLYNLLEIEPQ